MKRKPIAALSLLHRDQRGQMLMLGLFFFGIIAALLFMLFNTGDKINYKIQTQNAADAVAATGASWYARGLNVISMCNVTQTQLLSVIVLLDSLETVTPVSLRIIDDLLANIGSTPHGSDVPNDPLLSNWLIVNNARVEQQMLQQLSDLIHRVPIRRYCLYDSGILWQTCYMLNELATQTARITPELVQREAIKVIKRDSQVSSEEEDKPIVGFVVPYTPELPIQPIDNSGNSFRNFRRPMVDARTPDGRRILGYSRLQWYVNRRGGNWRRSGMGPFNYMRQPFIEPTPMGLFELSRFSTLMRQVSDKKLDMLFGGPDAKASLQPQDRIEDYDELMDYVAENGAGSVLRTYWTTMNFDSRYEYDTVNFFNNINLRHQKYPRETHHQTNGLRRAPNGYTRADKSSQGADARHDLWFRSIEHKRALYPQLGIAAPHPPYHDDGTRWPYSESEKTSYYRNSFWRFNGADVGAEQWLGREYLPPLNQPPRLAPILLDRNDGLKNDENLARHFTIVGFAYVPQESGIWPRFFRNSVGNEQLICYAQTVIENPTSWDLFTQNWGYQLVMMTHWDRARQWMEQSLPQISEVPLTTEDVRPVREMLETYPADIVHDYMTH